ncbi:MAG: hypothetical protein YSLV5_ORF32 [Yellowstone Lake virophage 5]|uniref:Uncharacterized protein n=1 Tax=Yellowstone Lake virophage 5 TaxID=1557033 RepID=A0A0A0RL44_9VIRU|nr:MAG: hypothetical protein ASQ69_gp32 [Yellowstone Lake virophage 5]AIW01890.1 MAG: hypothetical protein YSLV5_ORF32 [Yellowstone Lake virophage 5]
MGYLCFLLPLLPLGQPFLVVIPRRRIRPIKVSHSGFGTTTSSSHSEEAKLPYKSLRRNFSAH